jgi:hypothetical protein
VILTPEELRELTQKKHADAQAAALRRLGIVFRLGDRGRPVVLRSQVELALGGKMQHNEPRLRL